MMSFGDSTHQHMGLDEATGTLFVSEDGAQVFLLAIDHASGSTRWVVPLATHGDVYNSTACRGIGVLPFHGVLVSASAHRLVVHDIATGAVIHELDMGSPTSRPRGWTGIRPHQFQGSRVFHMGLRKPRADRLRSGGPALLFSELQAFLPCRRILFVHDYSARLRRPSGLPRPCSSRHRKACGPYASRTPMGVFIPCGNSNARHERWHRGGPCWIGQVLPLALLRGLFSTGLTLLLRPLRLQHFSSRTSRRSRWLCCLGRSLGSSTQSLCTVLGHTGERRRVSCMFRPGTPTRVILPARCEAVFVRRIISGPSQKLHELESMQTGKFSVMSLRRCNPLAVRTIWRTPGSDNAVSPP